MRRSKQWPTVARLVRQSQRTCESFDVRIEDPQRCLDDGVAPIVSLYIDVRQTGSEVLSPVEQSLLERALNDWLSKYATCRGGSFDAHFTVHEMAVAYAVDGSLKPTVDGLLGL